MPRTLTDTDWRITYLMDESPGKQRTETVRAAYVSGQDDLPGWTILKDREHRIVKMIREGFATDIARIDPGDEGGVR